MLCCSVVSFNSKSGLQKPVVLAFSYTVLLKQQSEDLLCGKTYEIKSLLCLIYLKIRRNAAQEWSEAVQLCYCLVFAVACMYRCHGHSAYSLLLFSSICLAECALAMVPQLAAARQTAHSLPLTVLQYHRHKCARKNTSIKHFHKHNYAQSQLTE